MARIYHCHCQTETSDGVCPRTSCEIVGPAAPTWNGISASPDKRLLYVNDLVHRQLIEFRIDLRSTGGVTLAQQRTIKFDYPYLMDNVDATSGTAWVGSFALDLKDALS